MRLYKFSRKTLETDIELEVNLDGEGIFSGSTGIGFFDHLINTLSKHSRMDVKIVKCQGDTHVDFHHLVEDFGIVLGVCFREALGDKKGIKRFGFSSVPLDEALSSVSLDISGRSFLYIPTEYLTGSIREFDMELIEVFLSAFVREAKITLHVDVVRGFNKHHIAESIFKALAVAIREAIRIEGDIVPSTKGTI